MSVRAVGPRSFRDDADRADHELRLLRARWRMASMANGWHFPSDWPVPEVDAVCASLVHRLDVSGPLANLARARAQSGAGLEETLIDLAALHAVVSDPAGEDGLISADPDATPSRLLRVAALAWVDESLGELGAARTTDGLTGLASQAYLRVRLGEVYRGATRSGIRVPESHVLLVVTLNLADVVGWARLTAMVLVANVLREVFNGGESSAVLGPSVAVVLAEREPSFGQRTLSAGWLINERLRDDATLRAACPDMRVVGLPDSEQAARNLISQLSRA